MTNNSAFGSRLSKAKGIYIVPDFGRAGLFVCARGGAGVMLGKTANDNWSNSGFYNFGASALGGVQGVSVGSIVFVLMADHAV